MNTPHLGLIGPAGSGKDTVGRILQERYDYIAVAFADQLRRFVADIDPIYSKLVDDYGYEQAKRNFPYVRNRLIEVGDAAREIIDPDIWVRALLEEVFDYEHLGGGLRLPIVVTDVRRANEAAALDRCEFRLVQIHRDADVDDPLPFEESRFVDPVLSLTNDSTLDVLEKRVDELLEVLR